MASQSGSSVRSSSPFHAVEAVGDTVDYHQMGVNNCLAQSPHVETANTIPMANMASGGNLNSSSSNGHGTSANSGQDNKFSMNLIKFPHHNHNSLLLGGGGASGGGLGSDEEHHHPFSNHQQQQQQTPLSYSGLSEAMHNKNFKLDSDRTDISTSLAHFTAPLQHPAGHMRPGSNAALHHNHHHPLQHHNPSRFDEVDEDGGELGLDESGDKKFNQLQELENSLLMQNLQSNFLKKLDTSGGYPSSSNPDYRSLNRRSGFIDTSGSNATTTANYPQYQQQQLPASASTNQMLANSSSASSGSSNPFQRMMATGTANALANKAQATTTAATSATVNANNNFHAMNPSNSSHSIRNTTRSHIITDTLPGPESCV